jgi:hypothetical protein
VAMGEFGVVEEIVEGRGHVCLMILE